jgi:hypothetical protein
LARDSKPLAALPVSFPQVLAREVPQKLPQELTQRSPQSASRKLTRSSRGLRAHQHSEPTLPITTKKLQKPNESMSTQSTRRPRRISGSAELAHVPTHPHKPKSQKTQSARRSYQHQPAPITQGLSKLTREGRDPNDSTSLKTIKHTIRQRAECTQERISL